MEFEPDDIVIHPGRLEWGYGKVLAVLDGNKIEVYFADGGARKISMDYASLKKVEADEATLRLFQNIKATKLKKTSTTKKQTVKKYNTLPDLIDLFLKEFKQGFQDEGFIKNEREFKLKTSQAFHEKLARETLSTLLDERDYEEVCDRAVELANKSNLIHHTDKILLNNALKTRSNHPIFAKALSQLLYGEGGYEERFEDFLKVINNLNVATWPIATFFPYLMDPGNHIFMKPEATEDIAHICGVSISYQPEVKWVTYKKLQEFGEFLIDELDELNPLDMIDIQSFIWCTHRLTKDKLSHKH